MALFSNLIILDLKFMYSGFHRLFAKASKSLVPLFSIAFLTFLKKSVRNSTLETTQASQEQTSIRQDPASSLKERYQNWEWERIVQINSPEELSSSDILEKSIIVYQMTGNAEIDSQVALLSHLFCDKFFGKISERFQFVFLTPNPNVSIEEELLYVVFSKEGTKYVPLKKYISTPQKRRYIPNYNPLMNRLLEEVNKYHELSLHNISEHLDHLSCEGRDTYQLVVIPENNSEQEINRSKNVMEKFLKNKQIWNSEIVKSIITDRQTQSILGLNMPGIQPNKVYLISPNNENLIRKPERKFKILNKTYTVIPAEQIQTQFIFPPLPPHLSPQSYILKFNIDLNQTRPELITTIHDMMRDEKLLSELHIPKLLTFSKGQQSVQITIEKNNHDSIVHAYDEGCMYDETYKRDLLNKSNTWKYPYEKLDPQKLKEFVQVVTSVSRDTETEAKKSQFEYFKSEPETESVRHNSRLIVGEERAAVIQSNDDKLIFHYSKSCHSCKRFKGSFEEVAGEMNDVKFYRIDNDTNKTEGLANYNSTPIFVMYKKGYETLPWYFKMPYFTKALFSNFVSITRELQIMNPTTFKSHIAEHQENEALVKETLKEVI